MPLSEAKKASNAAYLERNKEKVLAARRVYRAANRDRQRAYYRAYRAKNRQRLAEKRREWLAENPGYIFDYVSKRRARFLGATGVEYTTAAKVAARFAFYGDACAYCGAVGALHADHVIPLSRGGAHLPSNIRPACPTCNRSKGSKTLAEWTESSA